MVKIWNVEKTSNKKSKILFLIKQKSDNKMDFFIWFIFIWIFYTGF